MATIKQPKTPELPRMPSVKTAPTRVEVRPPEVKHHTRLPTGPRRYRNAMVPIKIIGPGEPPEDFLAGEYHGSRSEWPIYWALWRKLVDGSDRVRLAPYLGGPSGEFIYQSWQLGGRSIAGGAVADFEIPAGRRGPTLLLRIQSYRFHLTAGPQVVAYDDLQRERLMDQADVTDIYEQDYMHLQGQELVAYIVDVMSGKQIPDPIKTGSVRRT